MATIKVDSAIHCGWYLLKHFMQAASDKRLKMGQKTMQWFKLFKSHFVKIHGLNFVLDTFTTARFF